MKVSLKATLSLVQAAVPDKESTPASYAYIPLHDQV